VKDRTKAIVVVDRRTYRNAARRLTELREASEPVKAFSQVSLILTWLRSERHYGSQRRRDRFAERLAVMEPIDTAVRAELGLAVAVAAAAAGHRSGEDGQ
jgi:hypothetical protein